MTLERPLDAFAAGIAVGVAVGLVRDGYYDLAAVIMGIALLAPALRAFRSWRTK